MAAESLVAGGVIDQRLDALDRALLGLLPRGERLALVADVEARAREAFEANPAAMAELAEPLEGTLASDARAVRRSRPGRRSRLALTAGVVGIVALSLLLFLPITYTVLTMIAEGIGDSTAIVLLVGNIVLVALGGTAAVLLGLTALVRLNRRRSTQGGHGWAITGLCTGPMPMLAGGLAMLMFGLPLMGQLTGFVRATPAYYVSGEGVPCSTGACPPAEWQQQPSPLVAASGSYYDAEPKPSPPAIGYPSIQSVPAAAVPPQYRTQAALPAPFPPAQTPASAPPASSPVAPLPAGPPSPIAPELPPLPPSPGDRPASDTTTTPTAVPANEVPRPRESRLALPPHSKLR